MANSNILTIKRSVDVVLCMDGTGSMRYCIDNIKENARRFYKELVDEIKNLGSTVEMLRIKIIVFRDYKSDGNQSMVISPFFELPQDESEFSAYLDGICASGGCDEDANGLEALYFAMNSDFVTGPKGRQVIVLFADTPAIPLGVRRNCPDYPSKMVDEKGLQELWECTQTYPSKLREKSRRLVIFAPSGSNYEKLYKSFNRSIFQPVQIHRGLNDVSFDAIIKILAASASNWLFESYNNVF